MAKSTLVYIFEIHPVKQICGTVLNIVPILCVCMCVKSHQVWNTIVYETILEFFTYLSVNKHTQTQLTYPWFFYYQFYS